MATVPAQSPRVHFTSDPLFDPSDADRADYRQSCREADERQAEALYLDSLDRAILQPQSDDDWSEFGRYLDGLEDQSVEDWLDAAWEAWLAEREAEHDLADGEYHAARVRRPSVVGWA